MGSHAVRGDVDDVEPDKSLLKDKIFKSREIHKSIFSNYYQFWKMYLDFESLLPNGVEGVAGDHLGFVLAAIPGNAQNLKSHKQISFKSDLQC